MLPQYGIYLSVFLIRFCAGKLNTEYSFTRQELLKCRNQVKALFYHGFDSYIAHGYPLDEVRPISCVPKGRKFDEPEDTITNDVLGNFTTTLVDAITTIAVFGDRERFAKAIDLFISAVPETFELDSTVQVFETSIRLLGGLLSAHLYATDPRTSVYLGDRYNGCLLRRAKNLGDKLLEAYLTPTGLPIPRINLRYGSAIEMNLMDENNAAASACPMFEFRLLSMLTLDDTYRQVSELAFNKTWNLRSDLNLMPMSFSPFDGNIYADLTGVGASIDSFYEYALKGAVLFDDSWLYTVWQSSIHALNAYTKADWFYTNVKASTGELFITWIDSLSAFFPGLLVLDGRVEDATKKNLIFSKLWATFGGIPERWNFQKIYFNEENEEKLQSLVDLEWYPLRPEFIESSYFLYRATKDVYYQTIGKRILEDFEFRFRQQCGFAGLQDVLTGELQDRMESFVLGETLKYLYLLFDEENELHKKLWNHVFSTEAHPFWINSHVRASYDSAKEKAIRSPFDFHLRTAIKTPPLERQRIISQRECNSNQFQCNNCPFIKNKYISFMKSNFVADSRDLFEIDYRYDNFLTQPAWFSGYSQLELSSEFYHQWVEPHNPQSKLEPTTPSFEGFILDRDINSYLLKTHDWHDETTIYHFRSIKGIKIRLEKLGLGEVDNFGEYVSPKLWRDADFVDTIRNSCSSNSSQPNLYRLLMIDGINLKANDIVLADRRTLFESNRKKKNSSSILSVNRKSQLLLECIPIINLYIV